ncbi:hypothetical protein BKA70DRAFT_1234683 [Coprinopsis sp. MPI-PUGE-AT-0042]|nr:hypothetical protein BKA70DRAFT_1234683 [Coprinopsis sp. MPI-PUGE-AT-0042]
MVQSPSWNDRKKGQQTFQLQIFDMPPKASLDNLDAFEASPVSAEQKAEFQRFLDTIPSESPSALRATRSATRSGAAALPAPDSPALPPAPKRSRKKKGQEVPAATVPSISAPPSISRSLTEDMNNYLGGSEGMDDIVAALNDRELLTPTPKSPTKTPKMPKLVQGLVAAIIPSAQAETPAPIKPMFPSKKFPPPVGKFSPPNPFPAHIFAANSSKASIPCHSNIFGQR